MTPRRGPTVVGTGSYRGRAQSAALANLFRSKRVRNMAPRRAPLYELNVLIAGIVSLVPAAMGPARADEADPSQAFFAQHCQACHTGPKAKGKFRLESLTQDFSDKANRERWQAALEQVQSDTMPPEERPRPRE